MSMTPVEFAMWVNGFADSIGDAPPSPEQWKLFRERNAEVMGYLAKERIMQSAEEAVVHRRQSEEKRKIELEFATMKAKIAAEVVKKGQNYPDKLTRAALAGELEKYDKDDMPDAVSWLSHPLHGAAGGSAKAPSPSPLVADLRTKMLGGLRAEAIVAGEKAEKNW